MYILDLNGQQIVQLWDKMLLYFYFSFNFGNNPNIPFMFCIAIVS